MELIKVDSFNLDEKVIVKDYILPKLFNSYNITDKQVNFNQEIIDYVIDYRCHKEEKDS